MAFDAPSWFGSVLVSTHRDPWAERMALVVNWIKADIMEHWRPATGGVRGLQRVHTGLDSTTINERRSDSRLANSPNYAFHSIRRGSIETRQESDGVQSRCPKY